MHPHRDLMGRFATEKQRGCALVFLSKGRVPKLKSAKVCSLTIEGGEGGGGVTQDQILIQIYNFF